MAAHEAAPSHDAPSKAPVHPVNDAAVEMSDLTNPTSSPSSAASPPTTTPADDQSPLPMPAAPVLSPSHDSHTDTSPLVTMPPPVALPADHGVTNTHSPNMGDCQIEPATPEGIFWKSADASDVNAVSLILLLPLTGARHPFTIDDSYLRRRNVGGSDRTPAASAQDVHTDGTKESQHEPTEPVDPWSISVYQVKELIWRDWRGDWETRPTNPSSIRLIHFGRLLDDKSILKDCRLTESAPNVIHMSVKPAPSDEDDAAADKLRRSGSRRAARASSAANGEPEATSGCSCCSVQ